MIPSSRSALVPRKSFSTWLCRMHKREMHQWEERHAKFAMMAGSATVYQDAFEPCREPLSEWRKSQADKFPDLEIKNIQVNTQSGKGKVVENLDQAIQCFAQVSDAFLFCGYCEGDRKIEIYAEDPLMADAVSLLQIIAMGSWLKKTGSE